MIGVVLLGHGSTDPRADVALQELVATLQAEWWDAAISHAYLDHCQPTLEEAVDALPSTVQRIVIVPLLLSTAFHAKFDVPRLVAALDVQLPLCTTHPLGPDAELAADAVRDQQGPVVLAVSGTSDASAQAAFLNLATYLQALRREPAVIGYASMAVPHVPEAIVRSAAKAVVCFTLFPGVFSDRIAQAAAEAGIPSTQPLWRQARVRTLIRERVEQALALE
ncbi:MAG: sirohydrochlorin chelatase [Candidatus Nanopelagicales bacterium]